MKKTPQSTSAAIKANGAKPKSADANLRDEHRIGSIKAIGAPNFSRARLVGKFPEIKHQPAPKAARYRLSEEVRDQMVRRMVLV
jgi:hypothetical protein